ncbi:MAG: MoaD/ThiS family protein [Candidatus Woesearchaeota archaeon]
MEVYIEKEKRRFSRDKPCKAEELLDELGINPSTVLIVRNGDIVLPDENLSGTDDVKILSVVSGG